VGCERLYAEARGQLAIERRIRIGDLPSHRAGIPRQGAATMPAAPWGVKKGVALDDDPQREMQRASGTHERARQLKVGARVDEHPRVLVTEPEEPELLEAPAHDALILERELECSWWVFCGRHTCSNDEVPPSVVDRT